MMTQKEIDTLFLRIDHARTRQSRLERDAALRPIHVDMIARKDLPKDHWLWRTMIRALEADLEF